MMSSMTSSICRAQTCSWALFWLEFWLWVAQTLTSLSQLELRVSRALGLLGALLPGPGGMPCSGGWPGHWLAVLAPRLVDKYCLTCCLWACWMWYLDGFSRWGCTWWAADLQLDITTASVNICMVCSGTWLNKALYRSKGFKIEWSFCFVFSWFAECWTFEYTIFIRRNHLDWRRHETCFQDETFQMCAQV